MTQPVDDVEKLARELAEAIGPCRMLSQDAGIQQRMNERHEQECRVSMSLMLPILRAHFAARDADLQRLREAATKSRDAFNSLDGSIYEENDLVSEACHALKAALHPNHQEPSE